MKKTLALVAALAMAASLVACAKPAAPAATTAAATTAAPAATTAAAAQAAAPAETKAPETEAPKTDWPKKTVNVIVPYGAGGDTDFNARALCERLTNLTGQSFVVTNVAGNGGSTGALQALSSDPDGYTILFHHSGFCVAQNYGSTDYTYDDTEFVGVVGKSAGNIITLNSKLGIKTVDELIEYSKAHPGELKIAANTGATTHATALLLRKAGADIKMVDAGGSADRITALLGGHVDIITNPINSVADYFKTGELVGLCTDNSIENETLVKEYGIYPADPKYGIGFPFLYNMMFPKGTDQAIVEKLQSLLDEIINNDADYQKTIFDAYLQEPLFVPGEEGKAMMQDVVKQFSTLDFKA